MNFDPVSLYTKMHKRIGCRIYDQNFDRNYLQKRPSVNNDQFFKINFQYL